MRPKRSWLHLFQGCTEFNFTMLHKSCEKDCVQSMNLFVKQRSILKHKWSSTNIYFTSYNFNTAHFLKVSHSYKEIWNIINVFLDDVKIHKNLSQILIFVYDVYQQLKLWKKCTFGIASPGLIDNSKEVLIFTCPCLFHSLPPASKGSAPSHYSFTPKIRSITVLGCGGAAAGCRGGRAWAGEAGVGTVRLGGVVHHPLVSCDLAVGDDLPTGQHTVIRGGVCARAWVGEKGQVVQQTRWAPGTPPLLLPRSSGDQLASAKDTD